MQKYFWAPCSSIFENIYTLYVFYVEVRKDFHFLFSGPAKISINIIYCLLALLILTCIPVPLLAYFCSRRRNKDKSNPSLEQISNKEEAVTPSEPCDSPKIGIYSVPNGLVLRFL